MKIRFRLLAAGLLLCPVALSGARAETASRSGSQSSSTQRAEAAKKKPAAKPADAKKPAASASTAASAKSKSAAQTSKPAAKATAKTPAKDSARDKDKDKDKSVASAKKPSATSSADKTRDKAKTATASTSKPAAKPGKSPAKTDKSSPEKTVAKTPAGKKKPSAASDDTPSTTKTGKPASGQRASATAAAATKAGKKSKAPAQDRDDDQDTGDNSVVIRLADESSSFPDGNLPPAPPPLFVPTGLGLRLFGMPTGLPDIQSPTTTLLNMAMLKTPANSRTTNTAAAPKATGPAPAAKPAASVKLIDPAAAKAAMQAVARKQSAFRPALADAAARRSSLPAVEENAAPSLAYLTGPVAFVTKGEPPLAAGTADNFWGSSGDWLFSHTPAAASSKAPKGKTAGSMASGTSAKTGAVSPLQAQAKSRPLPAAVPVPAAATPPPAAAADRPEPLAQAPTLSRPEMPAALAKAAAVNREGDLSERERAFVRSLTEAADRVDHSHQPGGAPDSADSRAGSQPAAASSAVTGTGGRARSIPVSATVSSKSGAVSGTAGFILTGGGNEAGPSAGQSSPAPASTKAAAGHNLPALHLADAETASGIQHSPDSAATPADRLPETLPAFASPATGKVDIQSEGQTEYDQAANKVIYTGKVELNSRAVRLRGDRVEVFLKQGGCIERLEASGHVVLRTQATAKSSGHMASAGHAAYNLTTGEITLSDWPKIQGDSKSHVSTAASTTMVLKADGRALTNGPNRTLISN